MPCSFLSHVRVLSFALLSFVAVATTATSTAQAADADWREAGRKLVKDKGNTLIRVEVVVGLGMGGQQEDRKIDATGAVVSPEGLTVVTLSTIDPMSTVARVAGPAASMFLDTSGSKVKSVKLYVDEKPVPATVVLRDADLGLAFLRPLNKLAKPLPALDLKDAAKPQLLDDVFILSRLGRVGNRELSLTHTYVKSLITKPRDFYVTNEGMPALGAPVFDMHGKLLGLNLLRIGANGPDAMGGALISLNFSEAGLLPIVLPAADVAETAAQAATAPAETPTPATSTSGTTPRRSGLFRGMSPAGADALTTGPLTTN